MKKQPANSMIFPRLWEYLMKVQYLILVDFQVKLNVFSREFPWPFFCCTALDTPLSPAWASWHFSLQLGQVRVAGLLMDCLYDSSGLWCIAHLNLRALPSIWLQSPGGVFSLNVCWSFVNGRFTARQRVLLCKCQHGLCWFSTSQGVREAFTHTHTHTL